MVTKPPVTSPFTAPSSPMTSSPVTLTSPSTRPKISSAPVPRTLPRTTVERPSTDPWGISHVHVDVAVERRPVGDRQASRFHVADQARSRLQVDTFLGRHVARYLAGDREGLSAHVGFDDGR